MCLVVFVLNGACFARMERLDCAKVFVFLYYKEIYSVEVPHKTTLIFKPQNLITHVFIFISCVDKEGQIERKSYCHRSNRTFLWCC